MASWKRCKGNVDPFKRLNEEILDPLRFHELQTKNQELLEIASPVMQKLYRIVQGSGFVIVLYAVNSLNIFLLRFLGDPETFSLLEWVNAIPGGNWAENIMGTHAASLSVILNKPFQVRPYENWCEAQHRGTTSAAPIHDPETGEIIGCLDMGGLLIKFIRILWEL